MNPLIFYSLTSLFIKDLLSVSLLVLLVTKVSVYLLVPELEA